MIDYNHQSQVRALVSRGNAAVVFGLGLVTGAIIGALVALILS